MSVCCVLEGCGAHKGLRVARGGASTRPTPSWPSSQTCLSARMSGSEALEHATGSVVLDAHFLQHLLPISGINIAYFLNLYTFLILLLLTLALRSFSSCAVCRAVQYADSAVCCALLHRQCRAVHRLCCAVHKRLCRAVQYAVLCSMPCCCAVCRAMHSLCRAAPISGGAGPMYTLRMSRYRSHSSAPPALLCAAEAWLSSPPPSCNTSLQPPEPPATQHHAPPLHRRCRMVPLDSAPPLCFRPVTDTALDVLKNCLITF